VFKILVGKSEQKGKFKDLGVDGSRILKLIFKKRVTACGMCKIAAGSSARQV
jgi:hypothetical protein